MGDDEIELVDRAIRIEKRYLANLSLVEVVRLNPTSCRWCYDSASGIAINPVTEQLWVVGNMWGLLNKA